MGLNYYKSGDFEPYHRVLDCEFAIEPAVLQIIENAKTNGFSGRDAVLAASMILERLAAEEAAQEAISRHLPPAA